MEGSEDISRSVVEELLAILEEQVNEIAALKTVLEADCDLPEWREEVETMKILHGPALKHKFAPFRALVLSDPPENLLPNDLNSVVRQILDTVREAGK